MEYIVTKISENKHSISEEESMVIKRAIPFYNNLLERYENTLLKIKEKNDSIEKNIGAVDSKNPFDIKNATLEELPKLDEIKVFVYSSWAKIVADVQTPFGCGGQRKKGIMKTSFKEVQKGKYINKKVREIMNDFIKKITLSLDIKENENN